MQEMYFWYGHKKAGKCIVEASQQSRDLYRLLKLQLDGEYKNLNMGISEMYHLTNQVFSILKSCNTLLCYEPSLEKCNQEHFIGCEKYGMVIYPKCKQGYTNWKCCVCAQECLEGFQDNGLYCLKPQAYGRGVGYPLWSGQKCGIQNPQGCETWGLVIYPKCKPGYHNVGCCICSPNCPEGWTDIGISCKKPKYYGRGVVYPVSVGDKCLQAQEFKIKVDCKEQLTQINNLRSLISGQFNNFENSNENQAGFADNLNELGGLINTYVTQCFPDQLLALN